ncbi:SKU5 similar 13 [Capsicum annuum]|nr:SKU5 similar 13 [Capsicum annuum]
MSTSTSRDSESSGKDVDGRMYRGVIGSLIYLTTSRPDIMFSVCKCARFQSTPKESHLASVKRIIRYLIGTQDTGLWYHCSSHFYLIGYSDTDFIGDKSDRKSTCGTCQILGDVLISWHNKKQNLVVLSTTEAKYIAVGSWGHWRSQIIGGYVAQGKEDSLKEYRAKYGATSKILKIPNDGRISHTKYTEDLK